MKRGNFQHSEYSSPLSAGKSTVDHDKWLQVGFRNRFKQQGEQLLTPPAAKNYTQHPLRSTEVALWLRTLNCQ
jgi:hypothetical protein